MYICVYVCAIHTYSLNIYVLYITEIEYMIYLMYIHTCVCVCVCIYICKQTGQEKSVVLILLYGVRIIYRRERFIGSGLKPINPRNSYI